LIGVDAYRSFPLGGCILDALSIKSFLTDDLGVSEERTHPISPRSRNPNPRRSLGTFPRQHCRCALQSRYNGSVERGDNIIVYYVGHGSSYHCSEHFDTKCRSDVCHTEALCPLDRDTKWISDISSTFF
ncbi:hypothetical protein ARMSODRAFT_882801, partial [Armillaria solidipes]